MNEETKRSKVHDPVMMRSVLHLFLVVKGSCLLCNDDQGIIFLLLGEVGHYFNAQVVIDLYLVLMCLLCHSFIGVYYYNFKQDIEPSYLLLFRNIISLQDIINIERLDTWIRTIKQVNLTIVPILICFELAPYLFFEKLLDALIFGLPNAWLMAMGGYYLYCLLNFQFLYFYIICKYFRMKVRIINKRMIEMRRRKRFKRIDDIICLLDALYRQINEYNTTYWSKFLLIIWLFYGTGITLGIYILVFTDIIYYMKLAYLFATITFGLTYLFIIMIAASVNYESKMSYKVLNSFYIGFTQLTKISKSYKLKTLYKVCILKFNYS